SNRDPRESPLLRAIQGPSQIWNLGLEFPWERVSIPRHRSNTLSRVADRRNAGKSSSALPSEHRVLPRHVYSRIDERRSAGGRCYHHSPRRSALHLSILGASARQ